MLVVFWVLLRKKKKTSCQDQTWDILETPVALENKKCESFCHQIFRSSLKIKNLKVCHLFLISFYPTRFTVAVNIRILFAWKVMSFQTPFFYTYKVFLVYSAAISVFFCTLKLRSFRCSLLFPPITKYFICFINVGLLFANSVSVTYLYEIENR